MQNTVVQLQVPPKGLAAYPAMFFALPTLRY